MDVKIDLQSRPAAMTDKERKRRRRKYKKTKRTQKRQKKIAFYIYEIEEV